MTQNVSMKVEGTKLVVEVDISKVLGKSASGKSVSIGTTGGNVAIPGHPEIKLGLNVYRPAA